jgi:hypothetical protein
MFTKAASRPPPSLTGEGHGTEGRDSLFRRLTFLARSGQIRQCEEVAEKLLQEECMGLAVYTRLVQVGPVAQLTKVLGGSADVSMALPASYSASPQAFSI